MGGKCRIKSHIPDTKRNTGDPKIADSVQYRPGRIISPESRFGLLSMEQIIHIDILCLHGHGPDVLEEMRGMRIFLGIAVSVVHPVQDGVSAGVEKRRALRNKGKRVEKFLPEFIHLKHLVGRIAVQEKCL